ncbi:MAG TPA: DUF3047 domain-containing protein [Desulfobacteraceae bacterium]|nr:DUF3047 domain-containing protein [Desulfobacteraceae bacterium]
MRRLLPVLFFCLFPTPVLFPAHGAEPFIREDFDSLADWEPVTFPKIEKHTRYRIRNTGDGSILEAMSSASASGIRHRQEFDVYSYPVVRWRWKVDNVYEKGDVERKSGDDYPLRVYIMFKYDPAAASLGEKLQYGIAKVVYGAYPPQSSLNYVWASKPHPENIYPSPYTDRARLIILRSGEEDTGTWVEEEVNIIEDYEKAFGARPPATASLAIMNDSDDTGEAAVSFMDYIYVVGQEE